MTKTFFLLIFLASHFCGFGQHVNNTSIDNAVADTSASVVPEISTGQLKKIIATGSALLLDTRPHEEWASGHLPGALNVAPKPGMPMSLYTSDVAEILRLVKGDKNKALVLYCNGPFCEKSKRVSLDLINEGFTNVLRYQLGTPAWRATGHALLLENYGLSYFSKDPTVVWVDARDEKEHKKETIKKAISIPFNRLTGIKNTGVIKEAKDNGRLPMLDHNTRIVVIGNYVKDAAAVADAITKEAFQNVNYYNGSFQEARKILQK